MLDVLSQRLGYLIEYVLIRYYWPTKNIITSAAAAVRSLEKKETRLRKNYLILKTRSNVMKITDLKPLISMLDHWLAISVRGENVSERR